MDRYLLACVAAIVAVMVIAYGQPLSVKVIVLCAATVLVLLQLKGKTSDD